MAYHDCRWREACSARLVTAVVVGTDGLLAQVAQQIGDWAMIVCWDGCVPGRYDIERSLATPSYSPALARGGGSKNVARTSYFARLAAVLAASYL